jgi:hypothetical protein
MVKFFHITWERSGPDSAPSQRDVLVIEIGEFEIFLEFIDVAPSDWAFDMIFTANINFDW